MYFVHSAFKKSSYIWAVSIGRMSPLIINEYIFIEDLLTVKHHVVVREGRCLTVGQHDNMGQREGHYATQPVTGPMLPHSTYMEY